MSHNLTIIIPSYNGISYISRTLESIRLQSYVDYICIIIDDNSTDGTTEFLEEYCKLDTRFQWKLKPKNLSKGAGYSRNFGFEITKGDYVYWFDSDDIMLPFNLEKKMEIFKNHPEIDLVLSPLQRISYDLSIYSSINKLRSNDYFNDYFQGKVAFFTSASIWKREALLKNKIFWNQGSIDDWDFNLQALLHGLKFFILDEPIVLYVRSPDSVMQRFKNYEYWEVMSELILRHKWFVILKSKNKLNVESRNYYRTRLVKIIKKGSIICKLRALYNFVLTYL
jgi:glycosyltransferase involved in cell wall biosynthesis